MTRRGWSTWVFLGLAAVWGVGLLVAALTVPVYSGSTTTYSSTSAPNSLQAHTTSGSATLVEVNGRGVLAVVAVPLAFVLVIALSLAVRRHRGRHGAGAVAWVAVGLVGAFTVVGALTIGRFVLPLFVLLACACAAADREVGTPPGTRTQNLMIKSHLL